MEGAQGYAVPPWPKQVLRGGVEEGVCGESRLNILFYDVCDLNYLQEGETGIITLDEDMFDELDIDIFLRFLYTGGESSCTLRNTSSHLTQTRY